jgi:hypothetical protein
MMTRRREKRARRLEVGRVRKDGSRVSWQDYTPSFAAALPMENGEMLIMEDGCSVQRRGDRVRWVEPAALLRDEGGRGEYRRAAWDAELEAMAAA